jgi:hypothetical protein
MKLMEIFLRLKENFSGVVCSNKNYEATIVFGGMQHLEAI